MKITTSSMACALFAAALLSVPALADGMNARVKSVDAAAHTFTVIEGGKDYTFAVTDTTKFIDAKGTVLPEGVKTDGFKAGTRLSISYKKADDKSVASEVKLRDKNREASTQK